MRCRLDSAHYGQDYRSRPICGHGSLGPPTPGKPVRIAMGGAEVEGVIGDSEFGGFSRSTAQARDANGGSSGAAAYAFVLSVAGILNVWAVRRRIRRTSRGLHRHSYLNQACGRENLLRCRPSRTRNADR